VYEADLNTGIQIGGYDYSIDGVSYVGSWPSTWQTTAAGTYTLTNKKIGSTGLGWTGSSGQATYTTTLQATIPTGNNTVTIPNASGTVSLISLAETLSNKTFASSLAVAGSASGTTVFQAQNVAGGTITLPTVDGTMALTADLGNGEMLIIMGVYV
jgi:hypothetical protein